MILTVMIIETEFIPRCKQVDIMNDLCGKSMLHRKSKDVIEAIV